MPTPTRSKALAGCDAEDLYYGIHRARDFEAARLCAYVQRGSHDEPVLGGAGILMMIYANGHGVARSVPLARRFACEVPGAAKAETVLRLEHLAQIERDPARTSELDVCDRNHMTSGFLGGECAAHWERIAEVSRERELAALTAGWSDAQKAALERLRSAANAYFYESSNDEVDRMGTARIWHVMKARGVLASGFVSALQAFERGDLPAVGAGDLPAADAALNASYTRARQAVQIAEFTTITAEGVRSAQRAWLRYRDAWVALAEKRYPQLAPDAWRAHFTRERTQRLDELAQRMTP